MSVEKNIQIAVAWADIIARAIDQMLPGFLLLVIVLITLWLVARR